MTVAGLTRLWPRLGRVLRCLAAGAIVSTFGWSGVGVTDADMVEQTERHGVRVRTLTGGLKHPWSLAFLPDGRMLVTERSGRLRYVAADGTLDPTPISGLPKSLSARRQGGLHDVALHPRFSQKPPRLLCLCRQGRRRLRHRARPGPARRPPPYRSGDPVPGVAEVVGRPPLRRARGVRRQRARIPHLGGPGRRVARAGPRRPRGLRHTPS